jgi:hypothetical protein
MKKLYVIVRADLPPGLQLAQSCHALRQFAAEHPTLDKEWFEDSNNLVCLQVPNQGALEALALSMQHDGFKGFSRFTEPDLDHALTAIAVHDSGKSYVGHLRLALKPAARRVGEVPLDVPLLL